MRALELRLRGHHPGPSKYASMSIALCGTPMMAMLAPSSRCVRSASRYLPRSLDDATPPNCPSPGNRVDLTNSVGHTLAMPSTLNVAEAKAKLSELLARVEGGEEFIIARAGKPIARLVPEAVVEKPALKAGMWRHLVPDDWNPDDALDEDDPSFWGLPADAEV